MRSNLVVLINPSHDDEIPEKIAVSYGARSRKIRRYDPPISLINLGGFIRDHGYDVIILDTVVEANYQDKLRQLIKENPLVIGFSVILGKFAKNALTLTKMIKEVNKDIPVVWGGKLVHLAQNLILDHLDVDYIVIGDGEIPFLNLLDDLKNGKQRDIPEIGFKDKGKAKIIRGEYSVENLDDIYVSKDFGWDIIKQNINMYQIPYFINLYTSRGCKFNCSFCYLKDIKGLGSKLRFRRRSVENVIREIEYLHKTFGINVVTFGDDDFLSNLKEVKPIIEYLKKNQIFIEHIWTNIYNLTPAAIELLAGTCQTVCYSIETTSPRLQKILNKHISLDRITKANEQLRKVGITTVHNILFGIPTETDDETKANIDCLKILKDINPHVRANTYILSPIPETPIFEFAKTVSQKDIEWDMEDLANFHFRYMGKTASKFRPYLTAEDNLFYETVSELANELFTELNDYPTQEQIMKIQNDKRLSYIFGAIDKINKPKDKLRKYILDQVIEALDQGLPLPKIEPY
jgi:radical SAM superfamily enzyme YgiQ (UPF0313 family)